MFQTSDIYIVMLLAALLIFHTPAAAQADRFALPACQGPDREFADRRFFVLCHDSSRKVPLWTAYELKAVDMASIAARPKHFRHDWELSGASAYDADYRNSGFSRGHMVPAADLAWSEDSMRATFLLSNVVPQDQTMNAGLWRKVEAIVRTIAKQSDAIYVFTGPIFDAPNVQQIGPGKVAVPTHIFKVVLAIHGDRKSMFAAIVPNSPAPGEPLAYFLTTVHEVEARTGLDFFSALEDSEETLLESGAAPQPW